MYSPFHYAYEQYYQPFGGQLSFQSDFGPRRHFNRRGNHHYFSGLYNQPTDMRKREAYHEYCKDQKISKRQKRQKVFEKRRLSGAHKQKTEFVNSLVNLFQCNGEEEEHVIYPFNFTSLINFMNDNIENEEKSEDEGVSTTIIHVTPNETKLCHDEDCVSDATIESENSNDNDLYDSFTSESENDIEDDSSENFNEDFEKKSNPAILLEAPASNAIECFSENKKSNEELSSLLDTLNASQSVIEHSISIFNRLNRHSNGEYSDKENTSSSTPVSDSEDLSTETLILRSRVKVLKHLQNELESQYVKLDSLINPVDVNVKRFKQVLIGKAVEYADKSSQLANNLNERINSIKGKGNLINSSKEEIEMTSSDKSAFSSGESLSNDNSTSNTSKPTIRRISIETLTDAALSD